MNSVSMQEEYCLHVSIIYSSCCAKIQFSLVLSFPSSTHMLWGVAIFHQGQARSSCKEWALKVLGSIRTSKNWKIKVFGNYISCSWPFSDTTFCNRLFVCLILVSHSTRYYFISFLSKRWAQRVNGKKLVSFSSDQKSWRLQQDSRK